MSRDGKENRAEFVFYGQLQRLVRTAELGAVSYRYDGQPAIKDAIEALGVPHTEVDLILVGKRSVDFYYRLKDRDVVQVYPWGSAINVANALHLVPHRPAKAAFILDVHLGKLAKRLRMLGFDCRYRNDFSDPEIIEQALHDELIILTRDRGILKHSCVQHGYLIGSERVDEQVLEVLRRFSLFDEIRSLKRCPQCNGILEPVVKEAVIERLKPKTARYYDDFHICGNCRKLYWKGSHYKNIVSWLQALRRESEER